MPDERDPQNAAPSDDGDTRNDTATLTATADPPQEAEPQKQEEKEEEKAAEAGEAKAEAGGAGGEEAQADEPSGEGEGDEEGAAEAAVTAEAPSRAEDETPQAQAADESDEPQAAARAEEAQASVAPEADEPADSKADDAQAATEPAETAKAEDAQAAAPPPAEDAEPTAGSEAAAEPADESPQPPQAGLQSETPAEPAEAAAEEPTSPPPADPLTSASYAADATAEGEDAAAVEPAPETAAGATEGPAAEPAAAAAAVAAAAEPAKAEAEEAEPEEVKAEEAKAEEAEPALDDPALLALREAKEKGTAVHGKVIGWNRGGFHVVIGEVTAFCPASEMELGRPRSPETYMDREMDFKVAKFQRRGRRVVLSRSDLLKAKRDEVLAGLVPGTVVRGTVTSLPEFGAFVDLGGIEGLVHVSEISRARVKQPKDALQLGQEVEVKVLKVEKGGDRISLSMKELEPDPWQGVAQRYPRGDKFTGKVLRHADFGMFVELEPDVEGLVHVSQLPPGGDMKDEALKPGNTIEGWVREVDAKRQRISLSLREVPDEDPWKAAAKRFPEGEMVEGTVESIAPFGVFINLAPGLTGLLPNSQTGLPRGTNPSRVYRPGQQTTVQVLSIDTRRKRISLGKEGSHVEATKADLQDFRKQQREEEKKSPSAMEAAFARLGLGGGEDDEG